MARRRLTSFDWAMKKLLRSKANFEILEGFLSELLKNDIHILEILGSESNKEDKRAKLNRVDLKVKNQENEVIIIFAPTLSAANPTYCGSVVVISK